jgi:hypothetical protein
MLRRCLQTESKGNFCLITVYSHKTFSQPQNVRVKRQTFSNGDLRHLRGQEKACCQSCRDLTSLFARILGLKHKAQQHTMLAQRFER